MVTALASVLQSLVMSAAQNLVAEQVLEAINDNLGDDEREALDVAVHLMSDNKADNLAELLTGKKRLEAHGV